MVKVKLSSLSTVSSAPTFSFYGKKEEKVQETAPAPGKYGVPPVVKFKRSPSAGFGSCPRNPVKKWGDMPGPGTYAPGDAFQFVQRVAFSTCPRLPKTKESQTPPPGTYKAQSALGSRAATIVSRPERKYASDVPGPGKYKADYRQVYRSPGEFSFGYSKKEDSVTFKNYSCAPGPGHYPVPDERKGTVVTRTCPTFSFNSRRPMERPDASPGPCFTEYSQF